MFKNFPLQKVQKGIVAGIILVVVLAAVGYFGIWRRQAKPQETLQETDLIGGPIPALNIPDMNITIPTDFEPLEPNQQERFRAKDVQINAPPIDLP